MKLYQLFSLIAVENAGSIRQAARDQTVSQSAIMRSIKLLEAELNAKLLHRDSHGVSLTVAGKALVRRAKLIQNELRNARNDIELIQRALVGDIKVSVSPTAAM